MKPVLFASAAVLAALAACSAPPVYMSHPPEPELPLPALPASVTAPGDPACSKEGEDVAGPDAGPGCCAGFERAPVYKGSFLRLDECVLEGTGRAVCIRCGDGRCGLGETACNCAVDCHLP